MKENSKKYINTFEKLAEVVNYSFIEKLNSDPKEGNDDNKNPRQVFSGHYVNVEPTPIPEPIYIAHSKTLFDELGFSEELLRDENFIKMFSGDISGVQAPFKNKGWATGYALSIYGTEYYAQCPFQTGNGYGDGRAISVLETLIEDKRWEFQLKGGGSTPYCRGADGRAVLRSSVREFLAQEHMHALRIPTSRSLTLFTSQKERVLRPWFKENSYSKDPERMLKEYVAISTRVAPSFIRVGQVELFGRRTRKKEYEGAYEELEKLVLHLIDREYKNELDEDLSLKDKVILLAKLYQKKLCSLVANWIRVGYCQGNFNSDNCAAGGFTLDFGPFGFIEMFDPQYQPWTGGGAHFSFFNQPQAAQRNYGSFLSALVPFFKTVEELKELEEVEKSFAITIKEEIEKMWAAKMGLPKFDYELFSELIDLMIETKVDFTIFFRELSNIPSSVKELEKSFYSNGFENEKLKEKWNNWLENWNNSLNINSIEDKDKLSQKMKLTNPKYTLREWHLVEAYEMAQKGDYKKVLELQEVMTKPYEEQTKDIEEKYYSKKPDYLFGIAGVSHVTCSS